MPITNQRKQIYQYCMSNFHYDYSTVPFLKPNLESGQNSQNWHIEMVRYIFSMTFLYSYTWLMLNLTHKQTKRKKTKQTFNCDNFGGFKPGP